MTKQKKVNLTEQAILEKRVLGSKHGLSETLRNPTLETLETDVAADTDKPNIKLRKRPAWIDEDDAKLQIPKKLKKYGTGKSEDSYQEVLRRQFQRDSANPSWADLPKTSRTSSLDEDDNEMMRCGNLLGKSTNLAKGILSFEKVENLNKETRIERINAVEFHPNATVALVAGSSGIAYNAKSAESVKKDGIVSIVQVNGTSNSHIHTVKFRNFPISCAHFSTNGEEFIVGSRNNRSFFYYDMWEGKSVQCSMHHKIDQFDTCKFCMSPDGEYIVICGKFGTIHLLKAKTKEWVCDLQMNNHVFDVSFSNDGKIMYSYSVNGEIYEWDMTHRYCIRKMFDEGCIKGQSLALSPNGQVLATGSSTGIVNLYEMPLKNEYLTPSKVVKNLVTSITNMCFNSTSEILAIASKEKENALRLVHFPSMTVFSNFPGTSNIGRPSVTSFSPLSGFFAVGTGHQSVLLYRLKHFKNY